MSEVKIQIRDLEDIKIDHVLNLLDENPKAAKELLRNTGLEKVPEDELRWQVYREQALLKIILDGDLNQDGFLDLEESSQFLKILLPEKQATKQDKFAKFDPVKFHQDLRSRVKNRLRPLPENIRHAKLWLDCQATFIGLKSYNQGLKIDESQFAETILSLRGWRKSFANLIFTLPYALYRGGLLLGGHEIPPDISWFPLDDLVQGEARIEFAAGENAIQEFTLFLRRGMKEKTLWSATGNLQEAFKEFAASHREASKILKDRLHVFKIHDLIHTPNTEARMEKALRWAESERPTYLGLGGGLTESTSSTRRRNPQHNLYFARSLLTYVKMNAGYRQSQLAEKNLKDIYSWSHRKASLSTSLNPISWIVTLYYTYYDGDLDYLGVNTDTLSDNKALTYAEEWSRAFDPDLNLEP